MPRKTKSVITLPELSARIGSPAVELRSLDRSQLGAVPPPRHKGWRWPCTCSAFVRPEGDGYLWVPCPVHSAGAGERLMP